MITRFGPSLFLFGWSVWLASAYLLSGPESYIRQHDTAEVNTPYYTALPLLATRGQRGFRDPLAGTGIDALANLKGDMPLVEAFFRIAPHWSNSGVLLFCQTLTAAVGMFLLLRRQFNATHPAALTAACWFSFLPSSNVPYSGFPTWYGWYIPALPFVLLILESGGERRNRQLLLAILTGAMLALGTPTASGILVLPVVAGWLLTFTALSWRRAALVIAFFSTAFLIVKAPTIAALVTSGPESHRVIRTGIPFGSTDTVSQWVSRLADAGEIVRAQIPVLIVAAGGWLLGGFRRRPLNLALGVVFLMLGATIVTPVLQGWQGTLGAVYRSYQIDRINRFLPFFAALACAFSLDHLALSRNGTPDRVARRWRRAIYATAVAVVITSLTTSSIVMNVDRERLRRAGSQYTAFFEQPQLQALALLQRTTAPFRIATFADRNVYAGQHPAFAWAQGLETADVYGTTYPLRYHAFWQRVIERTRVRRPDIRDYFDRWGNRAYLFNPAVELFAPLDPDADRSLTPIPFNLALLSLANVHFVVSRVPLEDEDLQPWRTSSGLMVYRNGRALPRFFIVHDWRYYSSSDALLEGLSQAGSATLRATAMLDESSATAIGPPPADARLSNDADVSVQRYEADRIELQVRANAPGLMIASNSFSGYWKAVVDGSPTPILPAYHAFQAVPVAKGQHHIVLTYAPPHALGGDWQPALIAIAVAALGGAAMFVGSQRDQA